MRIWAPGFRVCNCMLQQKSELTKGHHARPIDAAILILLLFTTAQVNAPCVRDAICSTCMKLALRMGKTNYKLNVMCSYQHDTVPWDVKAKTQGRGGADAVRVQCSQASCDISPAGPTSKCCWLEVERLWPLCLQ